MIITFLKYLKFLTIFVVMKLHAPLLPLVFCLMLGIVLGSYMEDKILSLGLLIASIIFTFFLFRWPRLQTFGIWVCLVLLGLTVGTGVQRRAPVRWQGSEQSIQMRQQLLQRYRQWGITEEAYGVVAAMTLGEKALLDKDLKETYSKVGAAHILALSGLHMMIIYSVISLFVGWRRFRMLSQLVIIVAIWAFAFLVGMSPSVVRSAFMISIYALLSLGYRERMSVNTLAFAALVMLLCNPQSLYDIGFQLSFMAVLAILLFNPLFGKVVPLHMLQRHRWLNGLWGMTTVSVSAQLGTAPLIAYYFGRFSTYFLLSNYVVIPLATLILYLAVASMMTFWWTGLQYWLVATLSAVVVLMNRLLEAISCLPYCSIDGLHLSVWQVGFLYIIIGSAYVLLSLKFAKFPQNV